MEILSLLMKIDENERLMKESNKILKDSSYIHVLKKLKVEFESEKEKYKEKESQLKNIREEYKKSSTKVSGLKDEISESEYKLYNEMGSNLKLIEGLQKTIEDKKSEVKLLEDDALNMLQKEDNFSKEKEALRVKLIGLKNSFYKYKDESTKKINKAKKDIEKGKNAIKKLEKSVPEKILKEYNIVKEMKGTGAATVEDGACTGCKIKVSSITTDSIAKEDKMVYCDNCGRIVFCTDSKK